MIKIKIEKPFKLEDTITCGQIFRFFKMEDGSFDIILKDRVINVYEKNNYLFAPVIGAGKKEAGNIFTGVVMGQAPEGMTSTLLTGIYGYERGINTFGLLEDGRAYFGA